MGQFLCSKRHRPTEPNFKTPASTYFKQWRNTTKTYRPIPIGKPVSLFPGLTLSKAALPNIKAAQNRFQELSENTVLM